MQTFIYEDNEQFTNMLVKRALVQDNITYVTITSLVHVVTLLDSLEANFRFQGGYTHDLLETGNKSLIFKVYSTVTGFEVSYIIITLK